MVVGDRDHDHLLGAIFGRHLLRRRRGPSRASRGCCDARAGPPTGSCPRVSRNSTRLVRRRNRNQPVPPQQRKAHPAARRQVLSLLVGRRAEHPHGHGGPLHRRGFRGRRTARGTSWRSRLPPELMKSANAYGSASCPAQIALCGEEPSSHGTGSSGRPGSDAGKPCERMVLGEAVVEVREQLGQLLGEVVRRRLTAVALERECGHRDRCRRPVRGRGRSGPGTARRGS